MPHSAKKLLRSTFGQVSENVFTLTNMHLALLLTPTCSNCLVVTDVLLDQRTPQAVDANRSRLIALTVVHTDCRQAVDNH